MLEQMERALVEEDPKFASTLRGTSLRRSARRRALLAGGAFLVGVVVLMAGAITQFWPVGVGGFLIMLASATIGLTALKGQQAVAEGPAASSSAHPSGFTVVQGGRSGRQRRRNRRDAGPTSGTFMERMEERWRRRRDNGGM